MRDFPYTDFPCTGFPDADYPCMDFPCADIAIRRRQKINPYGLWELFAEVWIPRMASRSKAAYSERKRPKSTFILTVNRPYLSIIQGKENRLPHAVVRKGQTERFLSYGESYKLYGAFRFLQYILQCYNFACSNRYIMQRLYLFLRLICAYLLAVVLIPVAWICKLFRRWDCL